MSGNDRSEYDHQRRPAGSVSLFLKLPGQIQILTSEGKKLLCSPAVRQQGGWIVTSYFMLDTELPGPSPQSVFIQAEKRRGPNMLTAVLCDRHWSSVWHLDIRARRMLVMTSSIGEYYRRGNEKEKGPQWRHQSRAQRLLERSEKRRWPLRLFVAFAAWSLNLAAGTFLSWTTRSSSDVCNWSWKDVLTFLHCQTFILNDVRTSERWKES